MKIYYICNRKRCDKCSIECRHTSDIRHSVNYRKRPTRREKIKYFKIVGDKLVEK